MGITLMVAFAIGSFGEHLKNPERSESPELLAAKASVLQVGCRFDGVTTVLV